MIKQLSPTHTPAFTFVQNKHNENKQSLDHTNKMG